MTCTLNAYYTIFDLLSSNTTLVVDISAVASKVGMTWRKLYVPTGAAPAISGIDTAYVNSPVGYSISSAAINSDGSATIAIRARVQTTGGSVLGALGAITCSFFGIPLCRAVTVSVPIALLGDQYVLDPNNSATNWFFRNKWHEVSYYAVAPNITPSGPHSCSQSTQGSYY